MRIHLPVVVASAALALASGSCSSSRKPACDPMAQNACSSGLVCEQVQGGEPDCFSPLEVGGRIFDLANPEPATNGVIGARVVALDANRAPLSPVAISGAGGAYAIAVPATRNPDGSPTGAVTLRADAAGYQTFPSGLRPALPVDLSTATLSAGKWVVASGATSIGLAALPPGNYAALHGTVSATPTRGGILVVAQPAAGGSGITGIVDGNGSYAIFNVPVGVGGTSYQVRPYAAGANHQPDVTLPIALGSGDDKAVNFTAGGTGTATLTGSVQFTGQNLPAVKKTSVILVVKSTFDSALGHGEAPPGLRDGNVTDVASGFTVPGVPDGDYVVLAAFENDGLVRDVGQGSTGLYEISVSGGVITQVLLDGSPVPGGTIGFKATGAISLGAPFTGTSEATPWPASTATPTLEWVAYPSTDHYEATVIDELGVTVCAKSGILQTDPNSFTWSSIDCTVATAEAGRYYQFIVKSFQTGGAQASRSEDLKGVFYIP